MLIELERNATAIRTLSFRLDPEGYSAIHNLSDAVKASPSVLMRLALSNLIQRQKKVKANSLGELMEHNHGT